MKTIFFIYSHDALQMLVKLETSMQAKSVRVNTKEGQARVYDDALVLDEDSEPMFRKLMLEAHADMMMALPTWMIADTPTDMQPVFSQFADFSVDRDFSLWVNLPDDWPAQYQKSADIKIQQFLVDYICEKWYEKTMPELSALYMQKLQPTKDEVVRLLSKKTETVRRRPSFL